MGVSPERTSFSFSSWMVVASGLRWLDQETRRSKGREALWMGCIGDDAVVVSFGQQGSGSFKLGGLGVSRQDAEVDGVDQSFDGLVFEAEVR